MDEAHGNDLCAYKFFPCLRHECLSDRRCAACTERLVECELVEVRGHGVITPGEVKMSAKDANLR
jgi:hypothetical protein